MNRKLLLVPFLLAGCGGDESSFSYPDLIPNEVIYAYPYDGQQAVSPRSPVIVRLADPLVEMNVSGMDELAIEAAVDELEGNIEASVVIRNAADEAVPFEARLVIEKPQATTYSITSFALEPLAPLDAAASYKVDFSGLETPKGMVTFAGGELDFTTAGMKAGPRTMADIDSQFTVTRMIPDGEHLPFVDFSALRLQFSQPLDAATVVYGDTISLLDESESLVPASVLVSGYRLTIDPVADLNPGEDYTLTVAEDALRSIHGDALVFEPVTMTAGDTVPRETMAQEGLLSSGDVATQCDAAATNVALSPLTGLPINCVPVESILLGDESISQAMGNLYAELAFVPNYPEVTPLRVPRGTLLSGSSLDVLVAGQVPMWVDTDDDDQADTPLQSGNLSVTFVSDANGFLMPNPYSRQYDAPRHVRLYLDVAMTADSTEANGSLSQDILHVEVVGTAMVKDGLMVIDAIGAVEPEVLGLESAFGLLSFHLESYADQGNAPALAVDTVAPTVQSWVPGDGGLASVRAGQPIIVNFSEPVSRESLALDGAVVLTHNEVPVAFDWRLDGSALVIEPQGGMVFSTNADSEAGNSVYGLSISSLVTDLAGNPLAQVYSKDFTMPKYLGTTVAPFVTASYPGFPCATSGVNLASLEHGRCVSGRGSDDILPVMDGAANRGIYIQFSQPMNPASITLGDNCDGSSGTFHVQTIDGAGACTGIVPGRLDVSDRYFTFTPDTPWQEGQFYRYVLESSAGDCVNASMCSAAGTRLQTNLLGGQGTVGPNMDVYFRGGASVDRVFQVADNMPSLDVNGDYVHQDAEPSPECDGDVCETPPNSTRLVVDEDSLSGASEVQIGCEVGGSCPDKQFLYLTGALVADVVGWNPSALEGAGGIEVHVYPNMLMTTSLLTNVKINTTETVTNIIFTPIDCSTWPLLIRWMCEAGGDVIDTVTDVITIELDQELDSGPQIMRVRYPDDGQAIRGYIRPGDPELGEYGPQLDIELEVYMDEPDMHPNLGEVIELDHNLHSYPLTLKLSGPVSLLPDGRMRIQQENTEAQQVDVSVTLSGLDAIGMTLRIPEGGAKLNYLSQPVKK